MELIRRLKENRDSGTYPFHMPGHKRNLSKDPLFSEIYGIDITEIEGFDDLHNATGIIKEAEEKTARLFGADETHFLVNGSTSGILAAICGTVKEDDTIVIAQNCHRSVYNALMLSGARPYVITPERESFFGIFGGVSSEAVRDSLDMAAKDGKTGKTAVVITSPTYEGVTSDIRGIAKVCHQMGATLIIDAAHGAHFGFDESFPESPVKYADIVITSVHKTLPAMTQTALIHISDCCREKDRIRKMLSVFTTSSPSYVLMSSIDDMTELISARKEDLFGTYNENLNGFYKKISGLKKLSVLSSGLLTAKGSAGHDRGKIVIGDMTSSVSGKQLYDILLCEFGICAEMAAENYVILMTSIADEKDAFDRLADALFAIDGRIDAPAKKSEIPMPAKETTFFENRMKEAMFSDDTGYVPIDEAAGKTAAGTVTVYPPGIPVVIPGCVITAEAVDRIKNAQRLGLTVTGLSDKEIAVTWERSST